MASVSWHRAASRLGIEEAKRGVDWPDSLNVLHLAVLLYPGDQDKAIAARDALGIGVREGEIKAVDYDELETWMWVPPPPRGDAVSALSIGQHPHPASRYLENILRSDSMMTRVPKLDRQEFARWLRANKQLPGEFLESWLGEVWSKGREKETGGLSKIEARSLLRLIAVMARTKYQYSPDDARSNAPGSIQQHAQTLGVKLNLTTTRKWLREAAKQLPEPPGQRD